MAHGLNLVEWSAERYGYADLVRLANAWVPMYPAAERSWRDWDETRDPERYKKRYLAYKDGSLIGFAVDADESDAPRPGKSEVEAIVDLDLVGSGEHHWLLDEIIRISRKRGCEWLMVWDRESESVRCGMLEERGFVWAQRDPITSLDLQQFDVEPFGKYLDKAISAGYEIVSLGQMFDRYGDDWLAAGNDMENEVLTDMPQQDVFEPMKLEVYAKKRKSPVLDRDTFLFALKDGIPVGLSMLEPSDLRPDYGMTGLTGVARAHRRAGLAAALKVSVFQVAKARGIKEIVTDNEENNPMLSLNKRLGFREIDAWITFSRGRPAGV